MNSLIDDSYGKNKLLVIALIIPLTIVSKILQFTLLPEQYFYDSSRMLSMLTGSNTMKAWGDGYQVVVDVFEKFDFFNFQSLEEWAFVIAAIFSLILIFMIAKVDDPDFIQSLFILACVGLLNIYVFNISKEIIQYFIFGIMYLCILPKRLNPNIKVILCFLVFFWESTFFRSYYILMGALFVLVYYIFRFVQKSNKKVNAGTVLKILVIIFFAVFILIYLSKYISPEDYETILGVSANHENPDANSAINDLIKVNGSLPLFMLNYIINAIRMMIPVELLLKGPFYLPFVVFQVFVTFYVVKSIKKINKNTPSRDIIALAVICGYLLGSYMFEPDFGSFVRHEAATFPVLQLMALNKGNYLRGRREGLIEGKNI